MGWSKEFSLSWWVSPQRDHASCFFRPPWVATPPILSLGPPHLLWSCLHPALFMACLPPPAWDPKAPSPAGNWTFSRSILVACGSQGRGRTGQPWQLVPGTHARRSSRKKKKRRSSRDQQADQIRLPPRALEKHTFPKGNAMLASSTWHVIKLTWKGPTHPNTIKVSAASPTHAPRPPSNMTHHEHNIKATIKPRGHQVLLGVVSPVRSLGTQSQAGDTEAQVSTHAHSPHALSQGAWVNIISHLVWPCQDLRLGKSPVFVGPPRFSGEEAGSVPTASQHECSVVSDSLWPHGL